VRGARRVGGLDDLTREECLVNDWWARSLDEPVWCEHCYRVSAVGDLPLRSDGLVYCSYDDCNGLIVDLSMVGGDDQNEPCEWVPSDWCRGIRYEPIG
jgi:hypothetical protein